jgi:hypothetical protein
MFSAEEYRLRELRYRTLVQNTPVMVLSSQMALDDTERWVSEPHAPLVKLHFPALIEPDVTDADPAVTRRALGLPDQYILNCNQWFRHKNHVTLLTAVALLARQGLRIPCVFTGLTEDPRWPDHFPTLQGYIDEHGLADDVYLLGHVPRAQQLQLIRGARIIVQPSLFEGWSTIVEEARALGKEIIVSDIPVHREQSPPMAEFFEPQDAEQLAAKLREVWLTSASTQPDSSCERLALERHHELLREAGREFLAVSHAASRAYRPDAHSPALGAVRMLADIARDEHAAGGEQARKFAASSTRAMLTRQPDARAPFVEQAIEAGLERSPTWVGTMLSELKAHPPQGQPSARRAFRERMRQLARAALTRTGFR